MKIVNLFLFFYFILNFTTSFSQNINMTKEVDEIIVQGKDSIVQLALNLVDEHVDVQYFSKVKVMTDGSKVYVSLRNLIKYLPMNTCFYFDLSVELIEKTISYGLVVNGKEEGSSTTFYRKTPESTKRIQFVIDAINKSDEISSINIEAFDDDMIIREFEKYYVINVFSDYQESSYKIDKLSGEIYDVEHAHFEPLTFEGESEMVEVK